MNTSLSQYVVFRVAAYCQYRGVSGVTGACLRRPGVKPNKRQFDKDNVILKSKHFNFCWGRIHGAQGAKPYTWSNPYSSSRLLVDMSHYFNISPEAFDYQNAHINEDRGPALLAVLSILVSLSTIAVLLRVIIRWRTRVGFGADDFCVLVAWV